MEIYRIKPKNDIIIVDEKYLIEIEELAKLNQENIMKLAEQKYLEYIKENGIDMKININNVEDIIYNKNIVDEINYDERGYPVSITDEIKQNISDNVKKYINEHFKSYKEDCQNIIKREWNKNKNNYTKKYKRRSITFCILFITSIIVLITLLFTSNTL